MVIHVVKYVYWDLQSSSPIYFQPTIQPVKSYYQAYLSYTFVNDLRKELSRHHISSFFSQNPVKTKNCVQNGVKNAHYLMVWKCIAQILITTLCKTNTITR